MTRSGTFSSERSPDTGDALTQREESEQDHRSVTNGEVAREDRRHVGGITASRPLEPRARGPHCCLHRAGGRPGRASRAGQRRHGREHGVQDLGWINDARGNRDIRKLSVTDKLRNLAGDRASTMARTGDLEHPDCLSCLLRNRDISFDSCAETIAFTTYDWGHDAARSIFEAWRASPGHWDILMSRNLKRIGIGVAYRNQSDATFGAAVLAG